MNVLVIGQGGREHAIVRSLHLSSSVSSIHVVPGSAGMAKEAICHNLSLKAEEFPELVEFAKRIDVDLVVVGPEVPLADGIADHFRNSDFPVFGPNKEASQLEASKIFSKEFMIKAGLPTARSFVVSNVKDTVEKASNFQPPFVLKADGLAAGKGVFICKDLEELEKAATSLFVEHSFGEAGEKALLEEFQEGWELSYFILTDGKDFQSLPFAQDHKRLLNDDQGPNTGGMGAVAPWPMNPILAERIDQKVVNPFLQELSRRPEMLYRGVVFIGLMINKDLEPSVIEFNVRFGDPETQVLLPLLDGDWGEVLLAVANGELKPLKWKKLHSSCVVLAAPGYPDKPEKNLEVHGDVFLEKQQSYFLHAGLKHEELAGWTTSGGRVMNSVGLGDSIEKAIANSYEQSQQVQWPGLHKRKDIGQKLLKHE